MSRDWASCVPRTGLFSCWSWTRRASCDIDGSSSENRSACACIVLILSQSFPNCEDEVSHPVCSLWSECYPIPPAYTDVPPSLHETSLSRSNAWRRAPRSCVKRRIAMILLGCLWKSNARSIEDVEACGDILEFIR